MAEPPAGADVSGRVLDALRVKIRDEATVRSKAVYLAHFLAGFSVTLVFIVVGGLLLVLGAWPFCRPHLREQLP